MLFFLIQMIVVYYMGNWLYTRFTTYQENKDLIEKLAEKADISFVMNQLVEKADKNSIIDLNNMSEFTIGENSLDISIGNNSHFKNQNINIGFITINKKGISIDKIPIIKFNSNTVLYCSNNNIFIKEGNTVIKLSDMFRDILMNKDKIKKNDIEISDLKSELENKYLNKLNLQNNYYNKHYIQNNFISKESANNILVNNEGYSKTESNLIFMTRKDINETFIQKEYYENITNDKFNSSFPFHNNIINNHYLLCLDNNNIIKLCNEYKSKDYIGISYISNNNKQCIKPQYNYLWVSNSHGDITKGDLIVCGENGYGCKQDDDHIKNYTVAKCIENVNWNTNEVSKKLYCLFY